MGKNILLAWMVFFSLSIGAASSLEDPSEVKVAANSLNGQFGLSRAIVRTSGGHDMYQSLASFGTNLLQEYRDVVMKVGENLLTPCVLIEGPLLLVLSNNHPDAVTYGLVLAGLGPLLRVLGDTYQRSTHRIKDVLVTPSGPMAIAEALCLSAYFTYPDFKLDGQKLWTRGLYALGAMTLDHVIGNYRYYSNWAGERVDNLRRLYSYRFTEMLLGAIVLVWLDYLWCSS